MIEEVSSIRVDSTWDLTQDKIDEYKSINKDFVFKKEYYNVVYSINNHPVCICKFRFMDDSNIIIQDYENGEILNIGPMIKKVLMQIKEKFPDVNIFILALADASEIARTILLLLKDMYYSIGFARNPLFISDLQIEFLMDGEIQLLWAFDGNEESAMNQFIKSQKERIDEEITKKNQHLANNQEDRPQYLKQQTLKTSNSTYSSPDKMVMSEPKVSTRKKLSARKSTPDDYKNNHNDVSVISNKKRGRPSRK